MATNREIVSETLNDLRLLNVDEHRSRRYILFKFREKAKNLLSQRLLDRTLDSEANLYKEIKCFEMELIDSYSCPIVEFRSCNTIMKSVKPLPESVYSRLGIGIKEVTNIDGSIEFTKIDPKQYRRDQKRKVKDSNNMKYAVDGDNYLILLNSEVEAVNLKIMTLKEEDIESCDNKDKCRNVWDMDFTFPDKLLINLKKLVVEDLYPNRQIQTDINPDGSEYNKA